LAFSYPQFRPPLYHLNVATRQFYDKEFVQASGPRAHPTP